MYFHRSLATSLLLVALSLLAPPLESQTIERFSPSDSPAIQVHPDYRIRSFNESDFFERVQKQFISKILELSQETKQVGIKKAKAYLELAKLISKEFGHHDVAFALLDRAEQAAGRSDKISEVEELRRDAREIRERLARSRLSALQGEWEFNANSDIVLVPNKNSLKTYDSSFKNQELIYVQYFVGSPLLLDIDNGFIKVAEKLRFGSRTVEREVWIRASDASFTAAVIRPPGFEVYLGEAGAWRLANFEIRSKGKLSPARAGTSFKVVTLEEFSKTFPFLAPEVEALIDDISFSGLIESPTEDTARKYLTRFDLRGRHFSEASKLLHDLVWKRTGEAKSISGYEGYLVSYPEGEHATAAKLKIEEMVFGTAKKLDEFAKYIERYPQGQFVAEAERQIDSLRFTQAKASG